MSTALNFKQLIDLPKWKSLAPPLVSPNGVSGLICDLRNSEDRHPYIYYISQTPTFNAYNVKTDNMIQLSSGAPSNFTCGFFMSAQGPRGTITTTGNNTSFTLSSALPAAVGINQLANRGDGIGFKVRIIGNGGVSSSGKVEERYIIANTSGTTPTIYVNTPFSFIPATGDAYEFLSGRVFMLGSTNLAGQWKYYDVLTNSFSGNLSTTNLSATWTDSNLVGLDELLVPYDRNPGEGFLGQMNSTGTTSTTLIGQASGGDAGLITNQYRNFQIRIIQDTANPTAAGQRRNITSHTAGPSPIYTVLAWSVTPSIGAIYVIENNGDRIIAWTTASGSTLTYTISTNTWDSTTFANRTFTPGLGMCAAQSFSIEPDNALNSRHSYIFSFLGGNSSEVDLFDISNGTTGTWTNNIPYGNKNITFPMGTSSIQDPATNQGRYLYINLGSGGANGITQRFYRFDIKNRVIEPSTFLRIPSTQNGWTSGGNKFLAYTLFVDSITKLSNLIFIHPNTYTFSLDVIE